MHEVQYFLLRLEKLSIISSICDIVYGEQFLYCLSPENIINSGPKSQIHSS